MRSNAVKRQPLVVKEMDQLETAASGIFKKEAQLESDLAWRWLEGWLVRCPNQPKLRGVCWFLCSWFHCHVNFFECRQTCFDLSRQLGQACPIFCISSVTGEGLVFARLLSACRSRWSIDFLIQTCFLEIVWARAQSEGLPLLRNFLRCLPSRLQDLLCMAYEPLGCSNVRSDSTWSC